LPTHKKEQTAG